MTLTLYLLFLCAILFRNPVMTLGIGSVVTLIVAPLTSFFAAIIVLTSLSLKNLNAKIAAASVIVCYLLIAMKNTFYHGEALAGLSFVMFQCCYLFNAKYSQQIDRNFFTRLRYLTFFPQTLCGPILKPVHFKKSPNPVIATKKIDYGITLFFWGVVLKAVSAYHLAVWLKGANTFEGAFFGLYIYLDFAGWSMMASGIAYAMGLRFPRNFKHPWRYMAKNPGSFFKRWNASLFQWFIENVIINLKLGKHLGRLSIVIISTITLGLWHGLTWNFLVYSLGIALGFGLFVFVKSTAIRIIIVILFWNAIGAFVTADLPNYSIHYEDFFDWNIYFSLAIFFAYEFGGSFVVYKLIRRYPVLKYIFLSALPLIAIYGVKGPSFVYANF